MIAIIDYQMGNLRSVQKALEKVGANAEITSDPRRVAAAEGVILPGVGAFRDAIAEIRRRHLDGPVRDVIEAGKPFLGICLGLQMLFDYSEEDGHHEGLGLVPGKTVRFEVPRPLKVPHMGWNQVRICRPAALFRDLPPDPHFYFVHSYHVVPQDPTWVALEADYDQPFCAAIARGNLFATQFHPEKSQACGLQVLRNFAALT